MKGQHEREKRETVLPVCSIMSCPCTALSYLPQHAAFFPNMTPSLSLLCGARFVEALSED